MFRFLKSLCTRTSRPTDRQSSQRVRPRLEALESRYAPACTFTGGDTITGDGAADDIELRLVGMTTQVYGNGVFLGTTLNRTLHVNGGPGANRLLVNDSAYGGGETYHITTAQVTMPAFGYTVNFHNIHDLTLSTSAGHDTINLDHSAAGTPVTINAGGGGDILNVSPTYGFLDHIQGNVTFHGGSGIDRVNVYDEQDPFDDDVYTIGYSALSSLMTVQRTASAPIGFTSVEDLVVRGSSAHRTTYNVEATPGGVEFGEDNTQVWIYAGSADDTFNLSPQARNLANLRSPLYIDAGGGYDTVNLYDAFVSEYTVTNTSTRIRDVPFWFDYAGVDYLNLYTKPGSVVTNGTTSPHLSAHYTL